MYGFILFLNSFLKRLFLIHICTVHYEIKFFPIVQKYVSQILIHKMLKSDDLFAKP